MVKKRSTEKRFKFTKNKIFMILIVVVVAFAMLGLQACKKNKGGNNGENGGEGGVNPPESNFVQYTDVTDINKYSSKTVVGYSAEYLGTVDRQKPAVSDGGLVANGTIKSYPKWGKSLSLDVDQKKALINESSWTLPTINTTIGSDGKPSNTYNRMDAEGNLYLNDNKVQEGQLSGKGKMQVPTKLYKHTAADAMYGGGLSDSEPALIKRVSLRPRGYSSYSITGLYAPAGEIIKLEMSGADMNATNGITIHIGQALYNGKANNIWAQKGINRMPTILNTWVMTKATSTYNEETDTWTCYVGSFLGGPIYVRNTGANLDLTITGGVAYSHFVLGYTSQEEFEQNAKSTAPYFDLEVWQYGVLHSGPKSYAKRFSYDDLYKAANLWEKISLVATSNSKQGIVFLYDCFVAAGAAVAFPGQMSVNCPAGWMTGSLNYSAFVSGGSWGNMHEYHHNFQNYGAGSGADGEVTNNGLNLVAYSLFTKISSSRGIGNYGAAGLGGWNRYTSASWALSQVNAGSIGSTNGLALYATIMHNLGQDVYIKSRGARGNGWFDRLATNSQMDMTYYAAKVRSYGFSGGGNYTPSAAVKAANYPLFVPVASVYQTGRTYMFNGQKREINTMQPYIIQSGKDFTVDLGPYTVNAANQYESGSVVIGNATDKSQLFKYTIKSVDDSKADGTMTKVSDFVYTFKPGNNDYSGKIYVTLEITTKDGAKVWNGHALDDVDLILEFQQSRESTKSTLERTTYIYDSQVYTDAVAAVDGGFKGYTSVNENYNHANPTQNANTDIWYIGTVNGSGKPNNTAGKKDFQIISPTDNRVEVIDGKLLFNEDGKYRVYLRGRYNCALYYSIDGSNYSVGATIKDDGFTDSKFNSVFRYNDSNTYFDIEFDTQEDGKTRTVTFFNDENDKTGKVLSNTFTGDRWLYIREVLISTPLLSANKQGITLTPYIGLGTAQWTEPMFTMKVFYFDKDGNALKDASGNDLTDPEDERIDTTKTVTKYYNKTGEEVSAEQANDTALEMPTAATYANAYRNDYEVQKQFTSDYLYTPQSYDLPSYRYSFDDSVKADNTKASIVSCNYEGDSGYALSRITDGNLSTGFHSTIVKGKAFELVVDLKETVKANHLTFYGFTGNSNGVDNRGTPRSFVMSVSEDGENFTELVTRTGMNITALNNTFDFEATSFRYYKLVVTSTASLKARIALNEIQFYYNTLSLESEKNNLVSLDNSMFTFKGNWRIQAATSNFGHVYIGAEGSEVKFEFTGTYLGIISSNKYGKNFEVIIDGNKVDSVNINEPSGYYSYSYLSQKLASGTHSVVIKCKGETSIDSIVKFTKED